MKIILAAVNAKYIHSNLAVYSLRASASEYRDAVELMEFTINQSHDEIMREIFAQQPEVICFSCYIWNISLIRSLATELHKVLPDTDIWLGGPEVTYDATQVLEQLPFLRGVMCGEGEQTFTELVGQYVRGVDERAQINGIVWRNHQGQVCENSAREPMNMDDLPFPYADLSVFKDRIIYYESSRGCPFSCSYCLSSVDRNLRFRSVAQVLKELQFFLDQAVPQVKFIDRTFNCSHERTEAIWTYIKEHDNGVTNFHFEVTADLLTATELEIIRTIRPGLMQLEMGVQSVNPQTLKEIRRQMDFNQLQHSVKTIQQANNIHQHLDLIAGLPYEDYQSFKRSFNTVYALAPQQLQLGFLKVLKGSYMHQQAENYGCLFQEQEPYEVLQTKWLSYQEVLKLKQVEEMVELYYNSGQYQKTMAAVVKLFSTPFDLYEALGTFYEQKGYHKVSHSRMRRYDILLEFIEQREVKESEFFKELLTFDLYARENLKNRPTWSRDPMLDKEEKQQFYHQEQETYQYLKGYEGYTGKQMSRMTHLEVFHWNVLASSPEPQEQMILFDYRTRDPLTGSACHTVVREV